MQRAGSLEKTLMQGNIEGRRRRGWHKMRVGWHHWLNGHESEQTQEIVKDRKAWHVVVHGLTKSRTQFSAWTPTATWGFPGGLVVKNLPVNAGDVGSMTGSGRSPGGGKSNPFQYSCLENPMGRGAWWAMVWGVENSWTRLSVHTHTCIYVLLPPDVKSQLIGKDPDAGKDWRQKEKGATEDEMVRWHHWLKGDSGGERSLACCSPRGRKELDTTEQLNWTDLVIFKCV